MSRFLVPVASSDFGEHLDLGDCLPDATMVLLCEVTNTGYVPRSILLPHQIYTADLAGKEWVVFPLGENHVVLTEGAR